MHQCNQVLAKAFGTTEGEWLCGADLIGNCKLKNPLIHQRALWRACRSLGQLQHSLAWRESSKWESSRRQSNSSRTSSSVHRHTVSMTGTIPELRRRWALSSMFNKQFRGEKGEWKLNFRWPWLMSSALCVISKCCYLWSAHLARVALRTWRGVSSASPLRLRWTLL